MTSNTIFSQKEVEYIKSQRLARIATAAPSVASSKEEKQGEEYTSIQPDVVPVGFDFDGDYFYVGGMNILKSLFFWFDTNTASEFTYVSNTIHFVSSLFR